MKYLIPLAILVAVIWYGVARFLRPAKKVPPNPTVAWPPVVTPEPPAPTATLIPTAVAKERRSADEIAALEKGFAGGKLPEQDRRAGKKRPTT